MYLTGILEIDPSQITIIKNNKKMKLLEKLLNAFGINEEEDWEQETFTAISILQQFYDALNKCNIDNVIRLAVDDYDFYRDDKGLNHDIDEAFNEIKRKIDPIDLQLFYNIYFVLEHLEDKIKYLIEIQINRKHRKGDYPIKIIINGVFTEFRFSEYMSTNDLCDQLFNLMSNQTNYDKFLAEKKQNFDNFIDKLIQALHDSINITDIKAKKMFHLIRPNFKIQHPSQIKHNRYSNPAYYGYYGFDNYFLYAWLWAYCLSQKNIYVTDFSLVDETGKEILQIQKEGFFSNEYATLNPDLPFEIPRVSDCIVLKDM